MIAARVETPSPGLTVLAPSISPQRIPVRGYPAHPAARPPVRGDRCVVAFDATDRLFIVSWEVE